MPDVYLLASEALRICIKAKSKIAHMETPGYQPMGYEQQTKTPKDVDCAIARVKTQYENARKISQSEDGIIIRISSDDSDAFEWALNTR